MAPAQLGEPGEVPVDGHEPAAGLDRDSRQTDVRDTVADHVMPAAQAIEGGPVLQEHIDEAGFGDRAVPRHESKPVPECGGVDAPDWPSWRRSACPAGSCPNGRCTAAGRPVTSPGSIE